MAKTLIIAEKPSVAADLARTLAKAAGMSKFQKEKDHFENDTLIISSAIGHLVELDLPQSDGKKLRWGFEHLPVIPETFALKPIEKTKERYRFLKKMMLSKDVSDLINACDAGREGELIFRYLVESVDCHKPVRRLWMQSMTTNSILKAWNDLRENQEMLPLAAAAKCRSESDWLVGINGTRALTAHQSRHGGFNLTPVGRVQTPTLTIIVRREKEIAGFKPRSYHEIAADWTVASGEYSSRWFQENQPKTDDPHAKPERIWDRKTAEAILSACQGKNGVVEETTKPKRSAPPLLYDLTSLQREASNRFGFSAKTTLSIAQALYEKHKALTYPRTDSRYLPDDYPTEVARILKDLSTSGGETAQYASDILKRNAIQPNNKRIFDGSKVSDHFAIIPTGERPKNLSDAEAKLYDFVLRRFLSVFYPAAEFHITLRITRVLRDAFKTQGKILHIPGWLAVYGKEAQTGDSEDDALASLTPAQPGETARNSRMEIENKETKPPARYNEATLLSAMEGAGKTIEDEELRSVMAERGLGTPATRAAIIEGLLMDKYIQRDGRNLVATVKALRLIDEITDIGIEVLTAPELTGEWEYQLKQMQLGTLDRQVFMRNIRTLTSDIVAKTRTHSDTLKKRNFPNLPATCPFCGATPLTQTDAHYACSSPDCRFRLPKIVAARPLTDSEAITLLTDRLLPTVDGFRSRFGKDFSAGLQFGDNMKVAFVFADDPTTTIDPTQLNDPLCPCPICMENHRNGTIHVIPDQYICSERAANRKTCPAALPRELCKQPIPRTQALKFFQNGTTDVIEKFISKKGRPFSASLVLKPSGKKLIEWEFPPREAAPGAKKAPARKIVARKKPKP